MTYKTILVHVDQSRASRERVRLAAQLARGHGAHLVGAAPTGVSRFIYETGVAGTGIGYTAYLDAHLDMLRDQARKALDTFETLAKGEDAPTCETLLVDDEAGAGIGLRGHYSDLIVLGQINPDEPGPSTLPDFPEYVVMSSGQPVLILPFAGRLDTVGRKILVAWDASASATRAVAGAMPFLKQADIVDVVVINAEKKGDAHGEQPGADIALYLARHDVKVNVVNARSDIDIGNALLSQAMDLQSDMLVMGGYGHSRFRETLMGGATRTVLQSMTVPVLMAH